MIELNVMMYLGLSYKLLMWSFCRVARLQILKNNNWSASQILSSMLIWFFFFRLEANNPYAFFQHLISPLDAVLYFINNLLALKSLIDYKKKIIDRRHTGRKNFFLIWFHIWYIYSCCIAFYPALHFFPLDFYCFAISYSFPMIQLCFLFLQIIVKKEVGINRNAITIERWWLKRNNKCEPTTLFNLFILLFSHMQMYSSNFCYRSFYGIL
jgi:hypothetical protein